MDINSSFCLEHIFSLFLALLIAVFVSLLQPSEIALAYINKGEIPNINPERLNGGFDLTYAGAGFNLGNALMVNDSGENVEDPLENFPIDIIVDSQGNIIVIDYFAGTDNSAILFTIDPLTGDRVLISDFGENKTGDFIISPFGIATVPSQFILYVKKAGIGSGTIYGNGIECGSVCAASFDEQTEVTLEKFSESGTEFQGWSGDCSGDRSMTTVNVDSNMTCIATFNDMDECAYGIDDCDINAQCINVRGSYICKCNKGFIGDGNSCESMMACVTEDSLGDISKFFLASSQK